MSGVTLAIIAAICGGIAGAVFGGIASFITELCLTKHRKIQTFSFSLAELIDSFCGDVAAYWAKSGQDQLLEQQIIRTFETLHSKVERFSKIKKTAHSQDVERILKEVHTHATGGLFATVRRNPESNNAEYVRSKLQELSELLKVH